MIDIEFKNKTEKEKADSLLQVNKLHKYIKENTKELFPFSWQEIESHVNNLIGYYSYLAEQTGQRIYNQRLIKLLLGKDLLQKKNSEKDIIYLTQLDLYFLEWHLKDEIAECAKNKELIDLKETHYPDCSGIIYEE